MDFLSQNLNLVVYKKPVNMHRSFNGLVTLAMTELNLDLTEKTFVLFMNRKRNQFKILFLNQGHVTIFTMRISGAMQKDFTKINAIHTNELRELIRTAKSRRKLFEYVLDA